MLVSTCDSRRTVSAHPKMPSTPSKPSDVVATPIDWPAMTNPDARVTVSVYSFPIRVDELVVYISVL